MDILLQWNSAPFTAGDAIPLSIQSKGAGLVIRAFLSRFEIPCPRPSSNVGASLLKRVLAVQNPIEDFSVGNDLFDPKGREVFFVGRYNEDAIVTGDKVLLIKMSGVLEGHSLKDWEEIDVALLKRWVSAYLQMRGKYRQ